MTYKSKRSTVWLSLLMVALAFGVAQAQTKINPAARTHVKMVNGSPVKFSSKLTKVIEMNFTFGYDHTASKTIIANTLKRVSGVYGGTQGVTGDSAFTIQRFVGPDNGTDAGPPSPLFTLSDLLTGQVIFANQISGIGNTSNGLPTAQRTAMQTAIETNGVGYFHLHGSGDDINKQWPWFTNTLHPMDYKGHGSRTLGPVYKNPVETQHIVTQNVLVSGMAQLDVPTSVDASGNEVVTSQPTRSIRNEWYQFNADIRAIPALAANVTPLTLYDPRSLGSALPAQYRRKGGNMYTYLYKVGNGMTHYLPAGHDDSEIMESGGFNGGASVGDWDRYFAQVLFFLAGYNQTPCDQSCDGLPVVDSTNHLTGTSYTTSVKGYKLVSSDLRLNPSRPAFTFVRDVNYDAQLLNATGKVVSRSHGKASEFSFNISGLSDGIYFMQVKIDGSAALTQRYALTSGL